MNKHLSLTLMVILLVTVVAISQGRSGAAPEKKGGLPGARSVIKAREYPSIQAAIDAVPKEGGVVQLPPGKFEIDKPLIIQGEDITLAGVGSSTHIVNTNKNGMPAIVLRHPDYEKNKKSRIWRLRIADLRLTGNEMSGHGIEALGVNEIFIDGVTVSYHGADGIRLDHCYEDPRVSDCLITYNKATGLNLIGCHDIIVSANQFEENHDALHCFDGFNLTMTGNALDDHLGHGVVIENTYGSVVASNMIEECRGTAVILDRDCYGIAISANVIAHNGAGVDLKDAHGISVSANTFTILTTDALHIRQKSGRVAVTGNSFSNSYIGDGKVRRGTNDLKASGIVLTGTSDVAISGNQFSSLKPKALTVHGETKRIVFANNVVTDSDSDHEKLSDDGVVTDNVK